ncbi:MAG: GMC family oxidoreductase [Deltaproteobacteria bacterium]|nr:GMC family oxidoreductase [Deltaproteobacteria bacterium]
MTLPWNAYEAPHIVTRDREGYSDDLGTLPEGSDIDCTLARRTLDDVADWVVVGSGAAGATVACTLAEAGESVVIVEEGPWVRTREFKRDFFPALKQLWRGMGTNVAHGRSIIPYMQGRCVGGTTVINSAIAWRTPEDILAAWTERLGVDSLEKSLDPHFTFLEDALSVRPVSDQALGENSAIFGLGAARLGIESHVIHRYDTGCDASSACGNGCRTAKKQSMAITFVPRTLRAGGRIYHSAEVQRVEMLGRRAVAVLATMKGPGGPHVLRVHARKGVIVAASTVQSPNILRRSGVRSAHLGEHFQAHPGVSVAARFDQDVQLDFGSTQGFNSLELLKTHGIKLESLHLPPELAIARLPGLGAPLMDRFADYGRLAVSAVVIKSEAEGRVSERFGGDSVRFSLTKRDMERTLVGLELTTKILFAAGAREVYPGAHGMPSVLHSIDEASKWREGPTDTRAYNMVMTHLFGATRMAQRAQDGVVGTDFSVHDCKGLYVVDSGVFPTNIGVNPQHTIMALARHAAYGLLSEPSR